MQHYRALETKLIHMRWAHAGCECEGEEALLEDMAEAWYALSREEQDTIRGEGPKTLLSEPSPFRLRELQDTDPVSGTAGGHRVLVERAV